MLDIRYVAGLFDGEGYIRINRWEKPESEHIRYNLFGGINMTWQPLIESLAEQFGGKCYASRRHCSNPKHRTLYQWMVSSKRCAGFLALIRPHLVVKADEVDLAFEFQESIDRWKHKLGHHYGFHPQRHRVFAHRERLYREISALKHRQFDLA